MPERDKLIQQLYRLLAEQRELLTGRLTDQVVSKYKELETQARELFQQLADGKGPGK